jgi:outer membrane murein-binding lipoprotein Lpp
MSINKLVFAGIMSVGLLASCAGNETVSKQETAVKTLTINLNGAATRTTNIAANPTAAAEATMNKATIGVFDSNGKVKLIQEAVPDGTGKCTVTGNSITNTDSVLVAVNTPTNTFAGISTSADFHAKTEAITELVTSNSEISTNLPMYGSGIVAGTTSLTAAVNVYHLVSKIHLNKINVAFDATGAYANATFTPTEVFLYNVPQYLNFYYDSSVYSTTPATSPFAYASGTTPTLLQGESGTTGTYVEYLGTGVISGGTKLSTSGTATALIPGDLYFYTTPNIGTNSSNNTRLIIKGTFSSDGTTTNNTTLYYPIQINHTVTGGSIATGTDKFVYPNICYNITVTIKGKGVTPVSATIDPASVQVTLTVQPFTVVSQNVPFN